ncbi:MAG: YlmH/Sll1252 family protein [Bacillales bacterium]|nr:YlmH/Sll1252 family protein [Bacillales bacterium]
MKYDTYKQDKILRDNVLDKYYSYLSNKRKTSTNFFNSFDIDKITRFLDNKNIEYGVYDKYPFLEKKIIYFGEYDNYITIFKAKKSDKIKHSNILGTLFSLGLTDDVIGDIIVMDDYFYLTTLTRLSSFIKNNLTIINGERIELLEETNIVLNKDRFLKMKLLVSSMRVDTIVSKITNTNRLKVNSMIKDNIILVNYNTIKSSSLILKNNDILSIRKYGKYIIKNIIGTTKKNNLVLEIEKYI